MKNEYAGVHVGWFGGKCREVDWDALDMLREETVIMLVKGWWGEKEA